MSTSHEDQYKSLIISRSFLLSMRNVSDRSCSEDQETRLVFSNSSPHPQNRAFYKVKWKNIVERGRPQMTIFRMRIACWIPKATNAHSKYVVFMTSALRQWLQLRATMLRYTYIACLVLVLVLLDCTFSRLIQQ